MAKEYRYGFVITGDSEKGTKAIRRTREEVTALDNQTKKAKTVTKEWKAETDKQTAALGGHSKAIAQAKAMIVGLAGAAGIGMIVGKFKETVVETERLRGSLTTITGSVDNASAAFANLTEFAKQTPFTLDQSVTAFIRLKSMGLDPSERAMMSYGNTASAMGKDMMQMIEAVADAATMEFERLKEFGIRAKQEADTVSFTFQGVTTTVAKESAAIQEYLLAIGENQFAGAMADQMERIPGLLSNLSDDVDTLYRTIGDTGGTDAFAAAINFASVAVNGLTNNIGPLGDALTRIATILAVGGALYLGVAALPVALNAGAIAVKVLGINAAATWMAMNAGVGTMTLLNTTLFGTSVSAGLASGSISVLSLAVKGLLALFVGWQIGDWLRDNFLQARIAGLAFVEVMVNGFERLSFAGKVTWESFSSGFDTATSWIKKGYAELLDMIASGLDMIGADDMAAGYARFADGLREGSGEAGTLAERIAALRVEMEGNIAANHQIIQALVDYEIAAESASEATAELTEEKGESAAQTKILTEAEKDLIKELENSQKATSGVISSLVMRARQSQMTARQQAIDNELLRLGAGASLQARIATIALAGALYDRERATADATEAQKRSQKAIEDWAKSQAKATEQAIDDLRELQKTSGEVFADFVEDGESAADAVIKAFKRMGTEILGQLAFTGGLKLAGVQLPGGTSSGIQGVLENSGMAGTIAKTGLTSFAPELASALGIGKGALTASQAAALNLPASAASGSVTGILAAIPGWGWAAIAATAAAAILNNDDGKVRSNAGFLVGPTPGAKSEYQFDVDPFSSGLNITGLARREDQAKAIEVIDQFRGIHDVFYEFVKDLNGTMDLSKATLRGLDQEATPGSNGTLFGLGGNGRLQGDIAAQINLFVDQLADHVWGLEESLLASIRSAATADEKIALLAEAVKAKSLEDESAAKTLDESTKATAALRAAEEKLLDYRLDAIGELTTEMASALSLQRSIQMQMYEAMGATALFGIEETIAGQIEAVAEHRDLIVRNHAEQMRLLQDEHKQKIQLAQAFAEFTTGIRLGDFSNLSSAGKFDLAQSNFRSLAMAAQGGDANALKQLQGAADSYVQLADRQFASSAGRKDVVSEVLSIMDGLQSQLASSTFDPSAANQALIDQLAALDEQLSGISFGINESIIAELKNMNLTLSELSPKMQESLLGAIGQWIETSNPTGLAIVDALGGIKGSVDMLPPGIGGYMTAAIGAMLSSMGNMQRTVEGLPTGSIPQSAGQEYLQGQGFNLDYSASQIADHVAALREQNANDLDYFRQVGSDAIAAGVSSQQLADVLGYTQADVLAAAAAAGLPAFAKGGIATGPDSGYLSLMHGTEVVTPIDRAKEMFGGNSKAMEEKLDRQNRLLEIQNEHLARIERIGFAAAQNEDAQMKEQTGVMKEVSSKLTPQSGVGGARRVY